MRVESVVSLSILVLACSCGSDSESSGGGGAAPDAGADSSAGSGGSGGSEGGAGAGGAASGAGGNPSIDGGTPDSAQVDAAPLGDTYFVGLDGEDQADCSGGTRTNPWRTFHGNVSSGCIKPGDLIYFLPGTYRADTNTFGNGFITFHGEPGMPITIAADPTAQQEVRFEGFFTFEGAWGVISGIRFYSSSSQTNRGAVVKFAGSHLTLKDSHVDGTEGGGFDCVKIVSGSTPESRSVDLEVSGCEIHHCPEDVIDVTGASNVRYRNNHLHHFGSMQIKGGTEDILVEGNRIHDFRLGLRGASMKCSDYCGSPVIPTLAIADRFVAKDVVIRNNIIHANTGWDVIGAHGWQDVSVYHNTFHRVGKLVLNVGHPAGFDFYDTIAAAHCEASPSDCESCGNDCWTVTFPALDIRFKNNIVSDIDYDVILVSADTSPTALDASNNLYQAVPSGTVTFRVGSQSYDLGSFPFENDSMQADPGLVAANAGDFRLQPWSPAINAGVVLGVTTDFEGAARDALPDLGALEHHDAQ